MRVRLASEEAARRLATRSILLKTIYELWAQGPTYEDVIRFMQSDPVSQNLWTPYKEDTTFKFTITAYNHTLKHQRQKEILQQFKFVDYKGRASMLDPELEVCILEDWPDPRRIDGEPHEKSSTGIWIGRKICEAQRKLVETFDLKKRAYIGNTSMEAEMSLIMANQAKAAPGKLLYDPFVGTGSMLYTSAWFGATVMGSDIDGRHIRGRHGKSVYDSAAQYGIKHRILDCTVFDLANHPIRIGGFIDSIITDPPYGVRAGAKRLGRKDISKLKEQPWMLEDGTYSHERPDYIPPSYAWEMSEVLVELLKQAVFLLRPGGRLVYWLPTIKEEYQDSDVPQMPGLKLISNSEQDYGNWARRLITMERTDDRDEPTMQNGIPSGHYRFRDQFHDPNRKAQ